MHFYHPEPVPRRKEDLKDINPNSSLPVYPTSPRISKSLYVPALSNVVIVLLAVLVTTSPFIYLVTSGCRGFVTEFHNRPCISDGTFISSLFSVNLAFGQYSFATVKLIDVMWDIIIGRGVQIVLGIYGFIVYKMALLRAMECYAASYELFLAAGIQQSTFSMASAIFYEMKKKNKAQRHPWTIHGILAAILLTVIYIALWPTLTSAMSGYTPIFEAMMIANDGSAVPVSQLQDAIVIHDGYRLEIPIDQTEGSIEQRKLVCNRTNNSQTQTRYYTHSQDMVLTYNTAMEKWLTVSSSDTGNAVSESSEKFSVGVQSYMRSYYNGDEYPHNQSNACTIIMMKNTILQIDSPVLNISVNWSEYNGGLYSPEYRAGKEMCQPGNVYQWGFSYDLALVWSICNLLFASLLYGLWIDAWRNSRVVQSKSTGGIYRALIDLVAAMRGELGPESAEGDMEKELRDKIKNAKGGLVVQTGSTRVVGLFEVGDEQGGCDRESEEFVTERESSQDDASTLSETNTLQFFIEV